MAKRKINVPVEDERKKQGLIFNGNDVKMKKNFCPPQIPEDIIFNVLKRLPAKSLMRFKIVCKAWHALIRDPYFAESHHVYSQTRPDSSYFLFYALNDEFCARAVFSTKPDGVFSSQLPVQIFDRSPPCTNIVNGLICLWDEKIQTIQLLNLTTGEKIALPRRESMSRHMPSQLFQPSHVLGFDPFGKEYKVLYFCRGRDEEINNCYIITFGSKSWRKIIDVPQVGLVRKSKSINGAIYWKDKIFRNGERFVQYFDVGEEKFLLLSVPNEIGEQELKFITEVGGNLALGFPNRFDDYSEISLWIQKNRHDQVWVKATIKLPELVSFGRSIRIVGSTKSGEIFLTTKSKWSLDECWDTLIFYNMKKRRKHRTRKITMERQPNSVGSLCSSVSLATVSHHVENILPLNLPSV